MSSAHRLPFYLSLYDVSLIWACTNSVVWPYIRTECNNTIAIGKLLGCLCASVLLLICTTDRWVCGAKYAAYCRDGYFFKSHRPFAMSPDQKPIYWLKVSETLHVMCTVVACGCQWPNIVKMSAYTLSTSDALITVSDLSVRSLRHGLCKYLPYISHKIVDRSNDDLQRIGFKVLTSVKMEWKCKGCHFALEDITCHKKWTVFRSGHWNRCSISFGIPLIVAIPKNPSIHPYGWSRIDFVV